MKRGFSKIAKELGFTLETIRYERTKRDSVVYCISVYRNNRLITVYDCGYSVGEENTTNSKDKILSEFREYLLSASAELQ